jgi:hypothetical protein
MYLNICPIQFRYGCGSWTSETYHMRLWCSVSLANLGLGYGYISQLPFSPSLLNFCMDVFCLCSNRCSYRTVHCLNHTLTITLLFQYPLYHGYVACVKVTGAWSSPFTTTGVEIKIFVDPYIGVPYKHSIQWHDFSFIYMLSFQKRSQSCGGPIRSIRPSEHLYAWTIWEELDGFSWYFIFDDLTKHCWWNSVLIQLVKF